ncbi:hypothetical protein MMC17_001393 [Xylographa soralifera]|nr:hypothetical protein [Xylographa soralifera]
MLTWKEAKILGLQTDSLFQLEARSPPGAGDIKEFTVLSGGYRITFLDPERFPDDFVLNQELVETGQITGKLIYNFEEDKEREGAFQIFQDGPAAVHKHYTNGDTVNGKTPVGLGPASSESLSVWGAELPLEFLA